MQVILQDVQEQALLTTPVGSTAGFVPEAGGTLKTPLDHALAYAALGWPVFPAHSMTEAGTCTCFNPECGHPAKHPRTQHGFKDATCDPEQIREWWYRWPDANVAIATGEHSKLLIVDVDPRHGGSQSLAELECVHGPLPRTVMAVTGSGGYHPYFIYPNAGAPSRTNIAPGIDIRAAGGYVIAAPSRHATGNDYAWAQGQAPWEVSIAEAPPWLLQLILKPRAAKVVQQGSTELLRERARRYAGSVDGVEDGERNSMAFGLAGHVAALQLEDGVRLTQQEILEVVREWNHDNSPPLSEKELQDVVASALANGTPRKPKIVRAQEAETDGNLPEIDIRPGRVPQAADDLERTLMEQATGIFQRGEELVRLATARSTQADILQRPNAKILPIDDASLGSLVARKCRFYRIDAEGKRVRIDPPAALLKDLLSRRYDWKFQMLSHVTKAPALLRDGRVVSKPGLDAKTGIFFDAQGVEWPALPLEPNRHDAQEQLKVLEAALDEFSFETGADRSAALAMILTGCARVALGAVPLFAITAPCQSSGKSTLASLVSYIADGQAPDAMSLGETEEECEKRIFSCLREGVRFASLDNLEKPLKSAALCRVITEPQISGRVLGSSSMSTQSTTGVLWTVTGNNLVVAGDLTTRTLPIRVNTRVERPWEIEYGKKDLRQHALDHRQELMTAALTIIQAYRVAGYPDVGQRANRFPEWGRVIAGALMWLGQPDPLTRMRDVQMRDPEAESLALLLEAWESAFGGTPQTSAHVLLKASAPGALREVLSVVASKPNGELDSKRLGRFLSKFEDRIIDGRAFRRASTGRVAKWFLDRGGMNRNGVAPANALNLTEQVTLEIDAEGTQGAATCLP